MSSFNIIFDLETIIVLNENPFLSNPQLSLDCFEHPIIRAEKRYKADYLCLNSSKLEF